MERRSDRDMKLVDMVTKDADSDNVNIEIYKVDLH